MMGSYNRPFADGDQERKNRTRQASRDVTPVSSPAGAAGLLARLQRSAGNAAVNSLLRQYTIQREAEEEELQMKRDDGSTAVQREAEEEEELQMKREGGGDGVHAPVGLEGGPLHSLIADRIQAKRGGGSPLDSGVRAHMEGALGASFGDVSVHADAEADALNRSVSAVAFTPGSDIFFKQGAYDPSSSGGRQLLAHELTHVVQQRSMGGGSGGGLTVGPVGDSYEQQADAMSAAVARAVDQESPGLV